MYTIQDILTVNPRKLAAWVTLLCIAICDLLFSFKEPWFFYKNGIQYTLILIITWNHIGSMVQSWFSARTDEAVDKVVDGVGRIREEIVNLGNDVTGGITFTKVARNFSNHKIGIGLCTKDIIKANNAVSVGSEIVKIGSFLGLEMNVADLLVAGVANVIRPEVIEQHSLDECIPLLGSIATMTGAQVADIDISNFLKQSANNTKNIKVLLDQVTKGLETAGLIKPKNFEIIKTINEKVTNLREELNWVHTCVTVGGTEVCSPAGAARIEKFEQEIEITSKLMRSITSNEVKNNFIFTSCSAVISKAFELLASVRMMQSQKVRQKPVGVNIFGETGIGKTMISDRLIKAIKQEIYRRQILSMGDPYSWTTWNAQFRDEYDTGYKGDKIVYMDDAFQSKKNEDHSMWYAFISNSPSGMVMAKESEKGKPFCGILVVTSSNVLPKTSLTVNDISALHERFPFCIHARRIAPVPTSGFDPEFKHLEFTMGPMKHMIDETHRTTTPPTTFEKIVSDIVDQMLRNQELYQVLMSMSLEPVCQQMADDDEIYLFQPDEEAEGDYEDDSDQLPDIPEEDSEVEEVNYDNVTEYPLLPPFSEVRMEAGADLRWRSVDREIWNNLILCLDSQPITEVIHLGEWIRHLKRKSDGKSLVSILQDESTLTAVELLLSLGAYEIPQTQEFKELMMRVGFKKVEYMGNDYIWSPYICNGNKILFMGDNLRMEIQTVLLPLWKQRMVRGWRDIKSFWNNPRVQTSFIRFSVGITGLVIGAGIVPDIVGNVSFLMANSFIAEMNRGFIQNPVVRAINLPYWIMNETIDRLCESLSWLKSAAVNGLLSLLDILGVDPSPFLESMANFVGDVAIHSLILLVMTLLAWALYKLIRLVFEDKVEQKSPPDRLKPIRKFNTKKAVVQHSEGIDDDQCKIDDVIIDQEEFQVFHEGRNKETLYSGEVIDFILDLTENSEDNKSINACILKRFNRCYMVQNQDAGLNVTYPKTQITNYRILDSEDGKQIRITMEINENMSLLRTKFVEILKRYEELNVNDYMIKLNISVEERVNLRIELYCLNRNQGGNISSFVRRIFAKHNHVKDDYNGTKIHSSDDVASVVLHAEITALEEYNLVKRKHSIIVSKVQSHSMFDKDLFGRKSFGVGHENMIIFQEHLASQGELVRFWKKETFNQTGANYHLARVTYVDPQKDRSMAVILSRDEALIYSENKSLVRMNSNEITFPSLEPHLYSAKTWMSIAKSCQVIVHLPKTQCDITGQASYEGAVSLLMADGENKSYSYLVIDRLSAGTQISQRGDCGGIVFNLSDRYDSKMMGLYAAGSPKKWYATPLVKEDLTPERVQHYSEIDDWNPLVLPGKPKDMPDGPEVEFVGRLIKSSPPVSKTSLNHWNHSPWSENFEEQLEPSPLDAKDSRITVEIKKNQEGQPSLLMEQNSKMACALPEIDVEVLNCIEDQMVDEYAGVMYGNINTTPNDMDEVLFRAMNGHRENRYVTNMTTNKSAGLPWTLTGNVLKSDYVSIDLTTGKITFLENKCGKALKQRLITKLKSALKGERILSFSNSKVKDALIKKKCVLIGKVRVYHCIAVDKILADAALFGDFKEAYTKKYVQLSHAVGTDPHSVDWQTIADHLTEHNNFFDVDFENYDKYLHAELMRCVFNIIRRVIQKTAPDAWDTARQVLADESIETLVVDYDTIYRTKRGNKSGEFLTTIVNCIANDILSFYAWIKTTNNRDIQEFRENTRLITFGDDKVESVSDLYKDQYNYMTVKAALESIGHKITPGSKDGIEQPFTEFENLQFLKRSFKKLRSRWVAPLLIRSIEAPFTWTQIKDHEVEIWKELIKQQVDEALIISPEYYKEFCNKLRQCEVPHLSAIVAPLVSRNYEAALDAYFSRYMKYE